MPSTDSFILNYSKYQENKYSKSRRQNYTCQKFFALKPICMFLQHLPDAGFTFSEKEITNDCSDY